MRRGRVFKVCSTCGGPISEAHESRCGGRRSTWAYMVDTAPKGAPRRQAKKGGFATKGEAVAALNDLLTKKRRGSYVEASRLTLQQYLEDQWLPAIKGDVRPATFDSYESHVRLYIVPRLGDTPLQSVTRQQARAMYRQLAEDGAARGGGLSPKSVHNVHVTLRKALADAVEDGLVEHNVVDSAHKLPTDRAEMSVWTPEQLRAFLAYVAGDRLSALWRLAGTTGMRRGELLGPRWTDLDLDEGLLNVAQTRVKGGGTVGYGKPKTAKGRRAIALDSVTIAMLKAHRKAQAEERLAWGPGYVDEGLVFCREDGRPVDPDVLSQRFERLAREAGLSRIRLHDLRHTYATAALRAGVPVKVVSERLGHATPAITLAVYAHVLPGMDREAAELVAALVDGV